MAVVRIGITVLSALVAVPLTKAIAALVSTTVYGYILPLLGEDMAGFLTEIPVGVDGVLMIAGLAASPLLYLFVFLILRGLISIVAWIVEKCVPILKHRTLRVVSMPLGALNGIFIAAVTLIPLCGYMVFGAHMLNTVVDSGMSHTSMAQDALDSLGMTEEQVSDVANGLEHHPVVETIHGTVGKPVYTALTTDVLDVSHTHGQTVEINLERELSGLLVTAGHVMEVADSFEKEDYTAEDKELLFATADSFFASEWVKLLATDTLVAMSETWLENKPFAGIDRPVLDATLNPTVNLLLEILSAETQTTLEEDIHIILDVVGDLLVHDLLGKDVDYTEMVQKMGQSGLLTDMLAKLDTNERMHVLASEIKALSMRLVSNMLGVDKLKDGEYSEMMSDVAGTLTDSLNMSQEERDALILDSIKTNFSEQGFDVPDEVALEMSNQMIEELGADGEITEDELTEYLIKHSEEGFDITGDIEIPDELPGVQP